MSKGIEFTRAQLETAVRAYTRAPRRGLATDMDILVAAAMSHLDTMAKPDRFQVRCWPTQGSPMSAWEYETFSEARQKLTEMMDHRETWACEIRRIKQ